LGASNDEKCTIVQLKAELDLRRREEALELKQKMFELNEKKMEQASGVSRADNICELLEQLTDEDLLAEKIPGRVSIEFDDGYYTIAEMCYWRAAGGLE
jgi:hypothetical protein